MKTGNDVSANIQCKIKVCFEFLWKFYSGRCLVEQMTLVKYSLIFWWCGWLCALKLSSERNLLQET